MQPYPSGTKWLFSSKESNHCNTEELVLYAEPYGCWITDDYTPDDAGAAALWRMWVNQFAHLGHKRWPDLYRPGEVHISWYVKQPGTPGVSEGAPHVSDERRHPRLPGASDPSHNFLTHYTHPIHAETGEKLNWLRLPVLDRAWNATAADKGGFIQEATGWKPSPLQPTMDVLHLSAAAGLHVSA